eukprot:704799-Pyramimonas_sp.AAC.1
MHTIRVHAALMFPLAMHCCLIAACCSPDPADLASHVRRASARRLANSNDCLLFACACTLQPK